MAVEEAEGTIIFFTTLSQVPQTEHLPTHFGNEAPQDVHSYLILGLLISQLEGAHLRVRTLLVRIQIRADTRVCPYGFYDSKAGEVCLAPTKIGQLYIYHKL